MSSTDQQYPPGWLTRFRHGVGSGMAVLLIAFGGCAVAAFAAWLMPGADTAPATSALRAGALVLLAGGHGGVVLAGTPVTLTPLLVTVLLGWLVAAHARRQDSWSGFAGLVTGYVTASAVLAGWSRLGSTHAPVLRTAVASGVFVLAVGGTARCTEQLWSRLPARWRQVSRAAGLAAAGYLVVGSLLAAGTLIAHFSDAVALQRQLAPGAAGLPVALLGIAATPNAVLAAVGYLAGPGFSLGAATSVSPWSVTSGRLPVFPLLAGLPDQPPPAWVAVLTVSLPALLAGWAVLRTTAADRPALDRLVDCAAAAALAGAALAALTGLAAGDLGRGALRGIGAAWWAVGLGTAVAVLLAAACWLGVEVLRARFARPAGRNLYAVASTPARPTEPAEAATTAEPERRGRADEPAARSRTAS